MLLRIKSFMRASEIFCGNRDSKAVIGLHREAAQHLLRYHIDFEKAIAGAGSFRTCRDVAGRARIYLYQALDLSNIFALFASEICSSTLGFPARG